MLLMIRCLCDIEFNNMMYINRPKKNEFIDNISAAPHYPFIFRLKNLSLSQSLNALSDIIIV